MKTKARNATLLGVAAGLVLIPIVRAVIRRYNKKDSTDSFEQVPPNRLFAAYRGKFRPHHRKPHSNGVH